MELNAVNEAFDRVIKKQKLSTSRSHEVINQVNHEIEQALEKILSPQTANHNSVLNDLKHRINALAPLQQLESSQKDLNAALTRYPKVLEKTLLYPDISKAFSNRTDFEPQILNEIISNHFYQEGSFDLGDEIAEQAKEAKRSESPTLKSQLLELHRILSAMKARDLDPALRWVYENRETLKKNGSILELNLHSLQYVEILQNGNQSDALSYAKTYLAPFAFLYRDEIMKLMGCLAFRGRLGNSPYAYLLLPVHWERSTAEIVRQFCHRINHSWRSPLEVAIAAGSEALPILLKVANMIALTKQEWRDVMQSPVPVDLSEDFQFHSVFVCPVSKDQSSEENPPMMLPCMHVLCKQSIVKMSKSSTRTFKCPYCPSEASVSQCRLLYF